MIAIWKRPAPERDGISMSRRKSRGDLKQLPEVVPDERALQSAIADLPQNVRLIVLLGGRDGLSTVEIARLAGVSVYLVKAMQSKGHALIETALQMHG
jgi:DNA-directed RNA polymerase specialized sigma24 family protein